MPQEFYGGVGVDLLYPSGLGINSYSEPEWSSGQIVSSVQATTSDVYHQQPAPIMPPVDYQDTYPTPDSTSRPPPIEVSSVPNHMVNIPRPKSSPSTFGPNVEDLLFTENPFRYSKQEEFRADSFQNFFPSPVPSAKSSPYFGGQAEYASARTSPSRHVPIAPDPRGMHQLQSMKRMREDEEYEQSYVRGKRKRTSSASGPVELNEEEQLLLKLKEEENLPWKDIATRFQTELGKTYQVPALQMRFKRLRERMRSWNEADIQALEEAHGYWQKSQFDIISSKMLQFGSTQYWTSKQCARKWQELHPSISKLNVLHTTTDHAPSSWSADNQFEYHPSLPPTSTAASPARWQFLPDTWSSGHGSPVESITLSTPHNTPAMNYHSLSPLAVSRRSLTPQLSEDGWNPTSHALRHSPTL